MTVQGTLEMSGTGTRKRNIFKGNQWTEVGHTIQELKGFSPPAHVTTPAIKPTPHVCGTRELATNALGVQKLIPEMCEELFVQQ